MDAKAYRWFRPKWVTFLLFVMFCLLHRSILPASILVCGRLLSFLSWYACSHKMLLRVKHLYNLCGFSQIEYINQPLWVFLDTIHLYNLCGFSQIQYINQPLWVFLDTIHLYNLCEFSQIQYIYITFIILLDTIHLYLCRL